MSDSKMIVPVVVKRRKPKVAPSLSWEEVMAQMTDYERRITEKAFERVSDKEIIKRRLEMPGFLEAFRQRQAEAEAIGAWIGE
jgi:hypothetical protein